MKNLLLILLLVSNLAFSQKKEGDAPDGVKTEEIEITIGIDKTTKLPYKYDTRVAIGDESVLGLVLSPADQEVTFRGLRKGRTSVTFRNTLGERKTIFIVSVTANEKSQQVSELRELLEDVEGLEIGIKGNQVYVGGQIVVPNDVGKIEAVLAGAEGILRLYELSPQTQRMIASKMQEEISKNGMKNVTVRVVNKVYWVEGVVASEDQKKMVEKIVEGYLPTNVKGLEQGTQRAALTSKSAYQLFLTINAKKQKQPPEKLIKVAAQFVELSKDYTKVFGFKWAPLMGEDNSQIRFGKTNDGEVTSSSSGTLSGVISNLFPKLQSAKNAGYARVIQSGMVVVKNDKKANIQKNTTTNFAVGSGEFSRATTAQVGFTMDVQPRALEDEKVELSLGVKVSLPSGQDSTGNPIVSSSNLTTNVIIKSKQSAVIGGIVQNQTITQFDKDDPSPGNAESGSPLFFFLRSKSYNTAKNQFVIFVTPEIIESASAGTEEIRKKFRRRTR